MSIDSERLSTGKQVLDQLLPGAANLVLDTYQDIAPEMGRWIVEFAFGDVASRTDLSLRDRIISNLSALICLGGAETQIQMQIHFAKSLGLKREEIVGVFLNVTPICGFARAQNALRSVAEFLPDAEVNDER